MQQAQLQQLIMRSRQQTQQQQQQHTQQQQQNNARTTVHPSPIRRITLTNLNLLNTNAANNNDNNNNSNILITFGTYIRQNIRLLSLFRTIRNVLWNGIIHPNLNNTPRIRLINLRNNLRQINLGGIEIRPASNNVASNSNVNTDTRSTFQRNYEENNFAVSEVENSNEISNQMNGSTDMTTSTSSTPMQNDVIDGSTESINEVETESIKTDNQSTVTDTMKKNATVDEYSFELIEKHRTEFNHPSDDGVTMGANSLTNTITAITNPMTTTKTSTETTTTGTPISQSNEKSNQTILEKMEIREEDNSREDERKTYENLFTESSSEEICSSNKGDTGNCNVECRGNEFVEGDEVERNSRQNDRVTDGMGSDETNCDLNCKSKII